MAKNDTIGRKIGRYQILEEIGRGGMATVYRAIDTNLKRGVAVKLLHPHLASHGESRARFQREAQAVARLKHDALLEIYDYSGEEGNDVFIVMEFIKGTTLRRLLETRKETPFPAEAVALILRQVSAALAHAHRHGVIHRDVKPENILISSNGDIKLSDFGIAHLAGMSQMTVTGQILGSPAYMSPEHVELAELDATADIFSFGIVLYETAVGRQPFIGPNPHAVLKSIVEGKYDDPLLVNPGVGHHVAAIIRKCLKSAPSERYENFETVNNDLDDLFKAMAFDDPKSELKRFLGNPEKWVDDREHHIIEKTLEIGLAVKRRKDHTAAMNHFNRILALRPGDERALQAVAGMHRSQKLRRIAERAALVLTIALFTAAAFWAVMAPAEKTEAIAASPSLPPTEESTENALNDSEEKSVVDTEKTEEAPSSDNPPPSKDTSPLSAASSETAVGSKKVAKHHHRHTPRKGVRSNPSSEASQPKTREVIFTPHPLSITVVIDDRKPFPFGPENQSKTLSVGSHKISFVPNDPKRFKTQSWQVTIPDGEGPFRFRGRLQWQQAKLQVKSNVQAQVTVPGRVTDQTGRPFGIDVKKGPTEKLSVLISRDGYIPQTKQVAITAGELSTLTVTLQKAAE
jgi:eukaryotic-like serine/threonine-protein kinase